MNTTFLQLNSFDVVWVRTWLAAFIKQQTHIKKFCRYERMSIEEYAERFRIRNPDIPEQLYGRLSKIENINEQARLAQAKITTQTAGPEIQTGIIATSLAIPVNNEQPVNKADEPLKLSLRRDSSSGKGWVKSTPKEKDATQAAIVSTEPKEAPAQSGASLFASSTRAVTGNAMNSMFDIFRASFAAPAAQAATAVSRVPASGAEAMNNEDAPLKRTSASRGRGISRSKRN